MLDFSTIIIYNIGAIEKNTEKHRKNRSTVEIQKMKKTDQAKNKKNQILKIIQMT